MYHRHARLDAAPVGAVALPNAGDNDFSRYLGNRACRPAGNQQQLEFKKQQYEKVENVAQQMPLPRDLLCKALGH
jgi:hypothetical protein